MLLAYSAAASQTEPLHIAVASHFRAQAQYIGDLFSLETGIPLRITSHASGAIYAQITHGAPYHVFLSADAAFPDTLARLHSNKVETTALYAYGQLSAASTSMSLSADQQGFCLSETLHDAIRQAKQIAIANPKLAPYGKAASDILSQYKQPATKTRRLITANNAAQSLQYGLSGHADLVFTARSLIIARQINADQSKTLHYCDVPLQAYPPIEQKYAVLRSARKQDAMRFADFLHSDIIRQYLEQSGFTSAGKP